ncbi:hypothetical protein GCM10010967_02990 [Dyadobacter beijingensis]|uniref:Uncharacterized protein n=1 Tax=Dyadobacter beijingensis TaxID=365489 RepID=A0ABQ2HC28_9BACT|nr:hypothetical protein GCM10010967_02990 [Dyadobacter beijingensis]
MECNLLNTNYNYFTIHRNENLNSKPQTMIKQKTQNPNEQRIKTKIRVIQDCMRNV